MNCSNQWPANDKKAVCRSAYHKRYYVENRDQILTQQKLWRTEKTEILKTRRNRWYENNKERAIRSQTLYAKNKKEHVSNYRRQYRKNNREQLKGY